MYTSDDTQLAGQVQQDVPDAEEGKKTQSDGTWKKVAIGGAVGILMGGGAAYAANALASGTEEGSTGDASSSPAQEAQVGNGQSFGDAFNEARAQVGPGGVFQWHGRLYNTYTEEEWNAMSDEEKNEFARAVANDERAHKDDFAHQPSSGHATEAETHHDEADAAQARPASYKEEDVTVAHSGTQGDDDVHVVGSTTVEGHTTVIYDVDGDNQADVAVIDINDNNQMDYDDILIDNQGNVATVGQVAQGQGGGQGQGDDGLVPTQGDDAVADDPNIQASYMGDYDDSSITMGSDFSGEYDPGDDGSLSI